MLICRGESGIDAGGVYREGLSRIIDDLFSDRFRLLLPCPNNKRGDKLNSDSYIPNPSLRTPLAISMFEFAGRLIGISVRSQAALSFAFPSIVWKYIVGEKFRFDDLVAVDTVFAAKLEAIRTCDTPSVVDGETRPAIISEDEFAAAFPGLMFSVVGSDGEDCELVPGGASVPVTLASRARFCDAAEQFRLHEFDTQLAAIRRGIANVVPIRALSLFTWQECEVLAAGSPDVDVDVLKKNTEYSGYSKEDPVVLRFWKCLSSMTGEERSLYLRFVWGRSRLPGEGTHWSHTISDMSGGDKVLPLAHTCFW
jgi:E3 ubiquitin-protein ligase HERC2